MSKLVADRYGRATIGRDASPVLTAYGVSFAIGLIIFAIVLILTFARAARGHASPAERTHFRESLPRILFYVPLMLGAPALISWVAGFTHSLGEAIAAQSAVDFGKFMAGAADEFGSIDVLDLLGRAFLAIILLVVYLVGLLVWIVEDLVAQYALWILTVLFPIAAAMSLWRPNHRMLTRIIGVVIGCALVPTVTRFGYWVMTLLVDTSLSNGMGIMEMLQAIVVVMLSTSMPILFSYVMPAILPQGAAASDGGAGNWNAHMNNAGGQVSDGVGNLTKQFKGSSEASNGLADRVGTEAASESASASAGAGATASGGAAAGGAAAGGAAAGGAAGGAAAGGAASGAAAAGGPWAVAAMAAAKAAKGLWDGTTGAVRESALRSNTASGGGYATDPDTSSPARRGGAPQPGRRSAGGTDPASSGDAAGAVSVGGEESSPSGEAGPSGGESSGVTMSAAPGDATNDEASAFENAGVTLATPPQETEPEADSTVTLNHVPEDSASEPQVNPTEPPEPLSTRRGWPAPNGDTSSRVNTPPPAPNGVSGVEVPRTTGKTQSAPEPRPKRPGPPPPPRPNGSL
ncbi:hypothetical protein [Tessaracoccus flavescens]|uniref:hypothetical protein n=1 Tax=Tessaracoccus flavescens TaxID=399497 RepID=UPI0013747E2B|nr:hypothetical protein [Tessaracoccus flavescens]